MGHYKYGMYVKTIAKIKKDIQSGLSDEEVKKKYEINDGQLGFIHDKLLKGAYKKIANHEKRLLRLESKQYHSTAEGFGLGVLVEQIDYKWARIQFNGRKYPTLVNMEKMSFDLGDGIKGKVTRL